MRISTLLAVSFALLLATGCTSNEDSQNKSDGTKKSESEKQPSASKVDPEKKMAAIAKIKELGGDVGQNYGEGQPVYGVSFIFKEGVDLATVMEAMKNFPDLKEFSFQRGKMTDDDLAKLQPLAKFKKLRSLDVSNNELTDKSLTHLAAFTNLESLHINGNKKITDDGLKNLKQLTNLKKIFLGDSRLTDAAIVHIKGLSNLEVVNLNGATKITKASLAHLAELPNLKSIQISFTDISSNDLADFKKKKPNVKIEK